MNKEEVRKQRDHIISQLKQYSPLFKPFFEMDKSLEEYSKNIYDFDRNYRYIERQKQIKKLIENKFKKLFPKEYDSLNIDYNDQWACNIVDHHQILNNPLIISSNIITSIDKFLKDEKQKAIITISSGDVPPNNYFSRNGFEVAGKRVPIFTNKEKEYNSNLLPKRDFDFLKNLKLAKRLNEFNKEELKFLEEEVKWIQGLDYSGCDNYNDQISVLVKNQWPRMYEEKIRSTLPDLLYITQENITTLSLLEILDQDNLVTYTLFNKAFREKVIKTFRGIVVTWDESLPKGTHFFWRKHPDGFKSLRLYLEGDKLVPEDSRYKNLTFTLDQKTVRELLEKGEIYPSLFTIFMVVNFYYGIKPLVGQGSLTYLNLIRQKWLNVLEESDYASELDNIKSYKIDKLITGIIIFFEKHNSGVKTLWAYDIIKQGGIKEEYLKKLFDMPFKNLLTTAVVGIYDYIGPKYVPEKERIIPTVTSDELANLIFNWL
ncbi:MAG: hypothetical protein WCS88_02075 [Patescibacteria group bacterium]|jgi:hypothetical protein